MTDKTDLEWIEKTKNGDETAFKNLVDKYQNQIAAVVISMIGNTPEADDIGQETFIRFYQSMDKFRGDSGVGTYLTRIAINLSLNEIRRQKRSKKHLFNGPSNYPGEIPEMNQNEKLNDLKKVVQSSLQKLDSKYRSVIVLRLIIGYSTEETAQILKIPLGTVLSRLARGQDKLKKILSPLIRGVT